GEAAAHLRLKGAGEGVEARPGQAQPRRHGVATKLGEKARVAGGNSVQGVADMEPRSGAGGPLEVPVAVLAKGDHRAVKAILDAGRQQTHHTLMPVRIVQA